PTSMSRREACGTTHNGCISSRRCCAAGLHPRKPAKSRAATTCASFARRSADPADHRCRASGPSPAPECVEAAGVDQFARQLVSDDLLSHAAHLDQRVEIDTGIDAHLLAEQYQFLRANVAGRLRLPGEGTTAQPSDGRIELRYTHF